MRKQRLSDALAAIGRTDEQVFQIDAGAAAEGGEVVEPDGETDRRAVPLRDLAVQPRMIAKQRRRDRRLRRLDFVEQFLVVGEFADQGDNQCDFVQPRAMDGDGTVKGTVKGHSIAHTATSALMCGCGS